MNMSNKDDDDDDDEMMPLDYASPAVCVTYRRRQQDPMTVQRCDSVSRCFSCCAETG